jgi:hypothetical protein
MPAGLMGHAGVVAVTHGGCDHGAATVGLDGPDGAVGGAADRGARRVLRSALAAASCAAPHALNSTIGCQATDGDDP